MKIRSIIFPAFVFVFWFGQVNSQIRDELISNLQILSSEEMGGRLPGTKGHLKAREFIITRYKQIGLTPFGGEFDQEFSFQAGDLKLIGHNILGSVMGKTDKVMVISAHYDHLGKRNGNIYFGADDNASGVAALLYIAQYFKQHQPNHTLIFAAFDAEELGLQGARYFVSTLKPESVALNINMDMISRNDKNEIYVSGATHYPQLKPVLNRVNEQNNTVTLKQGHDRKNTGPEDWTYQSDHGEFHKEGIPFVYFGVEDHSDYHRHTDTFDKIDTAFYYDVVKMILDFTKEIDLQTIEK
ncbi:M20/M25/M40 family metallo-hydrolase [Reichenbachiella sp. MALMAid0571]|uniref:M20/M25/M40 family metallo-hydrolase n=1 Tax=Reichenbachiella sp. MALMAid0571 TaxID=3143939 RepID=UPI0032DFBF1A